MKKKIENKTIEGCKPEISYPCTWQYKIIGTDHESITDVVHELLKDSDFLLTESHKSSGGHYVSMNLELVVQSEEQRMSLFNKLSEKPAVKMIL